KRTFLLHLPASSPKGKPLPLVIALHGGGGQGKGIVKLTGLNELADRNNFIVVYPDGIERNWNDGRSTVRRRDVDDVKFLGELIEHLAKTYGIDRQRVYATGISNGGMMSLRLACELSDKIAAIASIAANLPAELQPRCRPARPVSVLMISGTADPLMPFGGGDIGTMGGRGMGGKVISAQETVAFWAKVNRTATKPVVTDLPDVDPNDGMRVRREVFGKGALNSEVVFYTITNGGHTWPGGFQYLGEAIIGKTSRELNASATMGEFFARHKRTS
ncbi:MAG: phospholipase, partial [Gammaproteobacteria bacterium]|nr:phospholipase [Gammaproteobacteria bacterium]